MEGGGDATMFIDLSKLTAKYHCVVEWSERGGFLIHRSNCVTALVPHSSVADAAAANEGREERRNSPTFSPPLHFPILTDN